MTSDRLNLISDVQRERAVSWLQQAYAKGVLDASAFEERVSEALTASTRGELNASLRGVARVASYETSLQPAPKARPQATEGAQDVGAGFVHLLGLPSGFIGPAIVKALSPNGSRIWWEAGRAMAWQFTSLIVFTAVFFGSVIFNWGSPLVLAWLGWFITTIVLSARAFNGQDSTGRMANVLLLRPRGPEW